MNNELAKTLLDDKQKKEVDMKEKKKSELASKKKKMQDAANEKAAKSPKRPGDVTQEGYGNQKVARRRSIGLRPFAAEKAAKSVAERQNKAQAHERSQKAAAVERINKAQNERNQKNRYANHCCCFLNHGCMGQPSCNVCQHGNHHVWPHQCNTSRKCNRL